MPRPTLSTPAVQRILTLSCAMALLLCAHARADGTAGADPDADYDRLDGMGKSGKKVQVIEWEGNLEIHVYPKGSLKGLSMKLDHPSKDKRVMVLGYRFKDNPGVQLVRRNILGIPLNDRFKTYLDPSEDDFDKIVVSNNGLSAPLALYKLEPAPKQNRAIASKGANPAIPATEDTGSQPDTQAQVDQQNEEDSGTIRPFFINNGKPKR